MFFFLFLSMKNNTNYKCNINFAGFPPDQYDPVTKTTALHIAVETGNVRAIQILLQAGAQINPLDSSSSTPLHLAAYLGYDDVIKTQCIIVRFQMNKFSFLVDYPNPFKSWC